MADRRFQARLLDEELDVPPPAMEPAPAPPPAPLSDRELLRQYYLRQLRAQEQSARLPSEQSYSPEQEAADTEGAGRLGLLAGLGEAGQTAAAAIAGTKRPDSSYWRQLGARAQKEMEGPGKRRADVENYMLQKYGMEREATAKRQAESAKGLARMLGPESPVDDSAMRQAKLEKMQAETERMLRPPEDKSAERERGRQERRDEREAEKEVRGQVRSSRAETELRKEFSGLPEVQNYKKVAASYDGMQRAAKSSSAAGDIALIFGYMKTIDPGSTVREGEAAMVQNAAGVPERIANLYNKTLHGERLTPAMRTDFMNQAFELQESHAQLFRAAAVRYSGLAKGAGMDPARVIFAPEPFVRPGSKQKSPSSTETPPIPAAATAQPPADALRWAREHPDDPRAARILKKLGVAP